MQIVNCLENDNEHVSVKYDNKDCKDNETLNLNKNHQNRKHDNFISEKYNPKFIINLLTERDLKGRIFFHFHEKTDFITLSSDGQLNVRGCKDHLFKFWGNSEFRNIKPNTVFQELEDKVIKVNFIPFSGNGHALFSSYNTFINWLGDNSVVSKF
jgi:hypothetical protein